MAHTIAAWAGRVFMFPRKVVSQFLRMVFWFLRKMVFWFLPFQYLGRGEICDMELQQSVFRSFAVAADFFSPLEAGGY